ncbi:hypothetical protein ACIQUF_00125 [Pseudomonas sp. NPDC090233]
MGGYTKGWANSFKDRDAQTASQDAEKKNQPLTTEQLARHEKKVLNDK